MSDIVPQDDLPSGLVPDDDLPQTKQEAPAPPKPMMESVAEFASKKTADWAKSLFERKQEGASTALERFGEGMADPVHGATQLVSHAIPQPVADVANKLQNKIPGVAQVPSGGIDQMTKEREARYERERAKAGSEGFDWARTLGNVVSPANLAVAAKIPAAVGLVGKIIMGALGGAVSSAMAPATSGNFEEEKNKQILTGGAVGGVLSGGAELAAKAIQGANIGQQVRKLIDEGLTFTPGQLLGGVFKRVEEGSTSILLAGDLIKRGQKQGLDSFGRVVMNRALEPIGESLPKNVPIGTAAVAHVESKLSNAYNSLLAVTRGEMDAGFKADIAAIKNVARGLPKAEQSELNAIIQKEVIDNFTSSGLASGETLKQIESQLGKISGKKILSDNYRTQQVGMAVKEAQESIQRMVGRVNGPDVAAQLKKINEGWANFKRIQAAAVTAGSKDGVFTPAQYLRAIRSEEGSLDKAAFARGKSLNQPMATAAQEKMAQVVPDSGTPLRMSMLNPSALLGLGGAGHFISPAIPLVALIGISPYFSTKATQTLLTGGGAWRKLMADSFRKGVPYATTGAAEDVARTKQ